MTKTSLLVSVPVLHVLMLPAPTTLQVVAATPTLSQMVLQERLLS